MPTVFEYLDTDGGVLSAWKLDDATRAKLDSKVDSLKRLTMVTAVHSQLMTGPIEDGIYKSRIGASGSNVALRPLLCRGPIDGEHEVTYRVRAREDGGVLKPRMAVAAAVERRHRVAHGPIRWRRKL